MLKLDHLTVIAPTLVEGVSHVRKCLDVDVPFGTQHDYMGTHNHRLQLGDSVYLEIVALDPDGTKPNSSRWFNLDNQEQIESDWIDGRRLRGCVASTTDIESLISTHSNVFGKQASLPPDNPEFDFSIPTDGSLPLEGAVPSLIDHRGYPTSMADIPDRGVRLLTYSLEHPEPETLGELYRELCLDRSPEILFGPLIRWKASIETPTGVKELT